MSSVLFHGFRLGQWQVRPISGTLIGPEGKARHLEPKVMDVFVCLAGHANELVTRERLVTAVWGERAVSDEPLTRVISQLRRALREEGNSAGYIQTIPKRGYRLIGEIRLPDGAPYRFTARDYALETAGLPTSDDLPDRRSDASDRFAALVTLRAAIDAEITAQIDRLW